MFLVSLLLSGLAHGAGLPARKGATTPALLHKGEELLAAWVEPVGRQHRLVLASRVGGEWSERVELSRGVGISRHTPALGGGEGEPMVAWESAEGHISVARRSAEGVWQAVAELEGESPLLLGDRLAWLGEASAAGSVSLRTARVDDGLGKEQTVDPRVCAEGELGAAWLGPTPILAWRDLSGQRASPPTMGLGVADGWEAAPVPLPGADAVTCADSGPALVASPSLGAAIAWTTGGPHPQLRLLLQDADGATGPLVLARGRTSAPVLVEVAGHVVALWLDVEGLQARRVDADGRAGATTLVGGRASGLPAVAVVGSQLLLVVPSSKGLDELWIPLSELPAPSAPAERVRPEVPDLPEAYVLPGLGGEWVDIGRMRGAPVLVNLWASWCPPCLIELPELKILHDTWEPRGLQMVGVAVDDQPASMGKAVEERGITWPVALDTSQRASGLFGTGELPTTILYDAAGDAVWIHRGEVIADDPELRVALEEVLGGD